MAVSGQSVKNPVNLKPDVACFLHLSSIMAIASRRRVALCSCLPDHGALLYEHQISQGICNIQIHCMVLFTVLYLWVGNIQGNAVCFQHALRLIYADKGL